MWNFRKIFNFLFCEIFLEFHKIQNNFVKILCFAKFWQCCFAATLCRSGVRGGAGRYRPGAPSALTQIVPYLSSLYTVFHSVTYNSVVSAESLILRENEDFSKTILTCLSGAQVGCIHRMKMLNFLWHCHFTRWCLKGVNLAIILCILCTYEYVYIEHLLKKHIFFWKLLQPC